MQRKTDGAPAAPQQRSTSGLEARTRLIDAAELLLGENSLQGASLRQIGAAAGQANNSAVQYHFGDKAGLIRAVIARRIESFEPRRRELLAAAEARGGLANVQELLRVLFLPLAEATDASGRHVYARFLLQFLIQIRYEAEMDHPGWASDSAGTRAAHLLLEALPFLGKRDIAYRIDRLSGLFLSAIVDRENAMALGRKVESEPVFLAGLFDMMAGAISVPVRS